MTAIMWAGSGSGFDLHEEPGNTRGGAKDMLHYSGFSSLAMTDPWDLSGDQLNCLRPLELEYLKFMIQNGAD